MTAKELAGMLSGREVGMEISREEAQADLDQLAEKKGWKEWNG